MDGGRPIVSTVTTAVRLGFVRKRAGTRGLSRRLTAQTDTMCLEEALPWRPIPVDLLSPSQQAVSCSAEDDTLRGFSAALNHRLEEEPRKRLLTAFSCHEQGRGLWYHTYKASTGKNLRQSSPQLSGNKLCEFLASSCGGLPAPGSLLLLQPATLLCPSSINRRAER